MSVNHKMQEAPRGQASGFVRRLAAKWQENPLYSTGAVLVIMIIVQTVALGFDFPTFGDWFASWGKNWISILRNNAPVGIVALGMAFVIISGGIDLAVGSTLVAVGAVMMVLINGNANGVLTAMGITGVPAFIIGILAALVMGCLIGGVNGFLIARSKLPAFIATLGTMKICRSVTQQFMQTVGVKVPREFTAIANTKIGGEIVLPIFYWLIIAAILVVVARKTPFGLPASMTAFASMLPAFMAASMPEPRNGMVM